MYPLTFAFFCLSTFTCPSTWPSPSFDKHHASVGNTEQEVRIVSEQLRGSRRADSTNCRVWGCIIESKRKSLLCEVSTPFCWAVLPWSIGGILCEQCLCVWMRAGTGGDPGKATSVGTATVGELKMVPEYSSHALPSPSDKVDSSLQKRQWADEMLLWTPSAHIPPLMGTYAVQCSNWWGRRDERVFFLEHIISSFKKNKTKFKLFHYRDP